MNPFEKYFKFDFDISRNNLVYGRILRRAKKENDKLNIIVDSSKDPRRLYALLNDPEIDNKNIYVLYLIRDGRAYINSFRKDVETINGLESRSICITVLEWIGVQLTSRKILKKYKLKNRVIKYQDFCEKPEKYIRDVYKFLGLRESYKLENVFRRVKNTKYHNLHGNPMRFRKLKEIKRDLSWREELGVITKAIINIIFYPFNKLWVFNDEPSKPFPLQ